MSNLSRRKFLVSLSQRYHSGSTWIVLFSDVDSPHFSRWKLPIQRVLDFLWVCVSMTFTSCSQLIVTTKTVAEPVQKQCQSICYFWTMWFYFRHLPRNGLRWRHLFGLGNSGERQWHRIWRGKVWTLVQMGRFYLFIGVFGSVDISWFYLYHGEVRSIYQILAYLFWWYSRITGW